MKQFDHFGDHMFDLLFAPLKKGKRAVNQFFIFFKVIGLVFDSLKDDALRVRDETNIATASPLMLPIHGQDRDMPRLVGEDTEVYRTRLAMKGIISKWSGTRRGILYVLMALGYEHSSVEPVYPQDPSRWAEFIVYLGAGNKNAVRNFYSIFHELQRIKEGSSKLACIVFTTELIRSTLCIGGTGGIHAAAGMREEADSPEFFSVLRTGGTPAAQAALTIPEDEAPPPSTTILRTGGVCTIISNLSKGD